MNGEWPADWDDPDEVVPGQADQPGEEADARLSAVSAYLASVPAPVLPDQFEARISAAIAAEAASRGATGAGNGAAAGDPAVDPAADPAADPAGAAGAAGTALAGPGAAAGGSGARTLGRPPGRARVRRRGPYRGFLVAGPVLVVCLLFAGLGFALSRGGSTAARSASGSAASSASSAAAAAPEYPFSGASGTEQPAATPFAVTQSGTRYRQSGLAGQVRAVIAEAPAGGAAVPGAQSSAAAGSASQQLTAPSAKLLGCVLRLTGGGLPKLVDRATYQGTPVYVIASSNRVWVVGLGCTATDPRLIASAPLAG